MNGAKFNDVCARGKKRFYRIKSSRLFIMTQPSGFPDKDIRSQARIFAANFITVVVVVSVVLAVVCAVFSLMLQRPRMGQTRQEVTTSFARGLIEIFLS